ncbi:hypothetical protein CY35_05G084800 [Sphagnum magellanicum]|nr:hypothetical protein CY35_05G084800 [Sphagnum magellanicum]KAH9562686.1 hypothetical protein CY35_05G084800 [Sphagnum magellanicum]KAH9562687.1 hypothetical protein CY35_05G084800 [Sphagnum magellanicum]KAH9562688.1 hypothetical protein CY35_05G084800 [Sphagnum magellanicum]
MVVVVMDSERGMIQTPSTRVVVTTMPQQQHTASMMHATTTTVATSTAEESEKKPMMMAVTKNGDEKREEWSERSVGLFLDLYEEKYFDMDKGSLRSKDWEQLVERFNLEAGGGKSVKQCRDKMDSLKKRHKLEKAKKAIAGAEKCTWLWFNKMDGLFGNNPKQNHALLSAMPTAAAAAGAASVTEEAVDTKCHVTMEPPETTTNTAMEGGDAKNHRMMVRSWREAKKLLKELPLSAEERGKARTLLLEKKEEERLEYFDGDFEEITFCLKLLVERSSFNASASSGSIQMDYMMATGIQHRLEEILTDVITLKRRASSDLRFVTTTKRGRG